MSITEAYRVATRLYPRELRREYRDDMVALVREQLREEHAARVVGRAALDLLVTVPSSHLEAHMNSSSTTALVITFVALGAALAVFGGPIGLAGAIVLFALAVMTWRRSRPVVDAGDGRWWKLLVAGVVLLGTLAVVTTITGELPNGGWYVAMATLLTSFGLMAAGIVLGIAGRIGSRAAES